VGAGFGDEGKGSIVDFLARKHRAKTVVRFNGGPQAGHRVVTSDGKEHVFSQFGAGTLAGARTHLSRFCLVNPISMVAEGNHLVDLGVSDAFERVTIEEDALVVTPFHVSLNRIRELSRGNGRHGSCGMGIGETVAHSVAHPEQAIRARDLLTSEQLKDRLAAIRQQALNEAESLVDASQNEAAYNEMVFLKGTTVVRVYERFQEALGRGVQIVSDDYLPYYMREGNFVFEGAQGVLLDEEWGFHPHTTRSNCTYDNANRLLGPHYSGEITRIAVLRAYHTRHGAGPFPTEVESGPTDPRNTTNAWQQSFRVGDFDFMLARYARNVLGHIDAVALGHLDQVTWPTNVGISYKVPEKWTPGPYQKEIPLVPRRYYEEDLASHQRRGAEYQHPLYEVSPVLKKIDRQERLVYEVAQAMKAPVTITSYGPTAEDKHAI
jgi:adenylosuccinate synthase